MAAPYIEHIIARITADLEFLESQSVITKADKDAALARLPSADVLSVDRKLNGLTLSAAANSTTTTNINPTQRTVPPRPIPPAQPAQPAKQMAKANWAYNSGDAQDLAFEEGDVIEILEESNPDWWKGRLNGREGLLPANYVTKLPPQPARSPNPPAYSPAQGYTNEKSYRPPLGPAPWQQQQQQQQRQVAAPLPAQYQPPPPQPQWQQQPPPQPVQQDQQQQQQQQQQGQSRFGGLGRIMATSAAGGLGFGAGAAIGGDLVNAIF